MRETSLERWRLKCIALNPIRETESAFGALAPGGVMLSRALYRIGDVMRFSGVSRQTLHNYTVFGLIREAERTQSGYRLYDERVFERLRRISEMKDGHTLREIKDILDSEEK